MDSGQHGRKSGASSGHVILFARKLRRRTCPNPFAISIFAIVSCTVSDFLLLYSANTSNQWSWEGAERISSPALGWSLLSKGFILAPVMDSIEVSAFGFTMT